MRGSLSVRINDGFRNRNVTADVKGLKFRKTAPGGHHSASMQVAVPHDTFTDLGPADKVFVYDARTSATIWEGYTEDPGVTDGPSGQSYDLTAMGGQVLLSDESRQLIYIDRLLDSWFRDEVGGVAAGAKTDRSVDPAGAQGDGLLMQFPPGQPVGAGTKAQMAYHVLASAGMQFGGLGVTFKSGKTALGYTVGLAYHDGVSGGELKLGGGVADEGLVSSSAVRNVYVGPGTAVPPGSRLFGLFVRRDGTATNITDDNTWTFFSAISVVSRRMDRFGVLAANEAAMVTTQYVRADWVVEDLLGRALPMMNPRTSSISAASAQIDQLAYPAGATSRQVLDDLGLWEPDFVWEVLESDPAGLHRFNYRAWPTAPRYEISTRDGYDAPGGEVDLCNRIIVYWTDSQGRQQSTTTTSTVPALGSRTRDAESITLPDGLGSAANALRIGQQILATKSGRSRAATAKVRRPIVDHLTHSTVMPWEIEPGYMVRVRETGEELRLTEMEYEDASCATTLTLGEPVLTPEQRIARLWASTRKAS